MKGIPKEKSAQQVKKSQMDQDIKKIKAPTTITDIHPLIAGRFSPRAFSDKDIAPELMTELFEAARWAASAFNEQPWRYAYAFRGGDGFTQLWECLGPGNQPWTKSAAVLMVTMVNTRYVRNAKENAWAKHDLGMANAQLLMQATHRNIYGHLMAGFDPEKVREVLDLNPDIAPVAMGAFGYLGDVNDLAEPYKTRELTARSRKEQKEFVRLLD